MDINSKRFQGRVGLITGGASGIGRAAALRLAVEGADIAIVDVNDEAGHQVINEITALGRQAIFIHTNVTRLLEAERALSETMRIFGQLNVLFTAAGKGGRGTVVTLTEQDWDSMFELDVKGVYLISKFAIPAMVASGGGAIVHISSLGGERGDWGGAAFTAAKHAVIGLTRHMAIAHAADNIRVNCICPGVIETPLVQRWLNEPSIRENVTRLHPLRRLGEPEEVAAAVAFLASDEASFITGAILAVDGGVLAGSGR